MSQDWLRVSTASHSAASLLLVRSFSNHLTGTPLQLFWYSSSFSGGLRELGVVVVISFSYSRTFYRREEEKLFQEISGGTFRVVEDESILEKAKNSKKRIFFSKEKGKRQSLQLLRQWERGCSTVWIERELRRKSIVAFQPPKLLNAIHHIQFVLIRFLLRNPMTR